MTIQKQNSQNFQDLTSFIGRSVGWNRQYIVVKSLRWMIGKSAFETGAAERLRN